MPVPPMFLPRSAAPAARPSAFAAILVDDPKVKTADSRPHHKSDKSAGKSRRVEHEGSTRPHPKHHSKGKKREIPDLDAPSRFAFDVPSPDDVVFNARKGSALAHHLPHTTKPFITSHPKNKHVPSS
jgi:hypothetical protein